jgi:hypothetical protein
MKEFYINTKETCVLDLIWGGGGGGAATQPMGRSFIIHTFVMESPSFSSTLMKKKRKIGICLYMCVYVNT